MRPATEQTPEQSFQATRQVYTLTSWPSELISTEEVRTPPQSASQLTSVGGVTAHFCLVVPVSASQLTSVGGSIV